MNGNYTTADRKLCSNSKFALVVSFTNIVYKVGNNGVFATLDGNGDGQEDDASGAGVDGRVNGPC
jgi:hypothetical protein